MKRAFTIVEVSILFVIFLIVAFLVAPMSLDDNMQAKNISRWRNVQSDFSNISYTVKAKQEDNDLSYIDAFKEVAPSQIKEAVNPYKITFMNGTYPSAAYRFSDFYLTYSGAVLSYKLYDTPQDGITGMIMYDVNGSIGPNVWGKDVFGINLYKDKYEPFCKNDSLSIQKQECSKSGTGLCCSNYYLVGGSIK